MSAGHAAHRDDVPAIDDALYARVKILVDDCKRDRDHTIPWTANRSVDGRTVYIDERVPEVLPKTGINTGETLPYHELGEWLGMNDGLDYDESHRTRGNPCEKRRVEELGGVWNDYQDEIESYVRTIDDESMTNVPADIDARVFIDDDDRAALEAIIADNKSARSAMTQIQRKFVSGAVLTDGALGERQIRVVASDATPDRAKDVMVPSGCQIENYKKNNIVLADHDPTKPIGNAEISVKADRVEALISFAPAGISEKADEYCGLAKAGVIKSVSVGFDPLEAEPRKGGGFLYKVWELMELSVLGGVPCNPQALVVARSLDRAVEQKADKESEWKVGASRNLTLDDDDSWDGAAAKASIFEHAGFDGDSPDTTFARKGFLVYDAANPKLKGSYKLPFARVKDGRLVAAPAGIRNAASRLPQTDGLSDDVAKKARAVIDHYEAKMKDADGKSGTAQTKQLGKNGKPKIKGLYDCAQLAYVLMELGFVHQGAAWEAEMEQDGSKLPEMLAGVMRECAEALVAMTQEEVGELLTGHGIEVLPLDEAYIAAAATPQAKALRAAFRKAAFVRKAGRVISEANMKHLAEVQKCLKGMEDCHVKAADLHDDVHDILERWMNHGTSAGEHIKAILKSADDGSDDGDENCDPDTDPNCPDDGSNDDKAAAIAQRKRAIEILEIGATGS